ncbi:MAG: hypothetical protein K8R87_07365, partial [Verrucomicrobia bacterium]|nr:hypothetical protein [Verrucomicrobiota bacterium]
MTQTEVKEVLAMKPWKTRVWHGLLWMLAFAPSIVVLILIMRLSLPLPFFDSWDFVKQYQFWCEGSYSWTGLLTPHNAHPSAIGKLFYFAVLHFAGGNVALLPLLSWLLSLLISIGVMVLSQSLWRGRPAFGACLMFLANLSIFTLVQGHAWLWDFIFQNFIPGACLVGGLLVLNHPHVAGWRWFVATLLALMAVFSFGTGFAVGFLLLPALGMALDRRSFSSRVSLMLFWAVMCGAAGWLALNAFGHAIGEKSAADLFSRPVASLQYILILLGHTLGRGTVVGPVTLCTVWGAVLLITFIACSWQIFGSRNQALIRQSWPWMVFCLWALFNALAICLGRFRATLDTGLAPRYATFMIFMPLGVLMLVATVRQIRDAGVVGRWIGRAAPFAAVLLLVAHSLSWIAGAHGMELFHRVMESSRTSLQFINVLSVKPSAFLDLKYTPSTTS